MYSVTFHHVCLQLSELCIVVLTDQDGELNLIFNETLVLCPRGKTVWESLKLNNFREPHHFCVMMSQTATSQTCCRSILTKDALVASWILEHHFLHFPEYDSISSSLASHSAQLSFFRHVPLSCRDGLFGSFQILPWNLLVSVCGYVRRFYCQNTHTHTQTAW